LGKDTADYKVRELQSAIPGAKMERVQSGLPCEPQKLDVISFYRKPRESEFKPGAEPDDHTMRDISELAHDGFLAVAFVPVDEQELVKAKDYIERELSKRSVRETHSVLRNALTSRISVASQRDMFIGSEETMLLGDILDSINNAVLSNGLVYKAFFITPSSAREVRDFITARFLILDRFESEEPLDALVSELGKKKAFPFGTDHLKSLLDPSGAYGLSYALQTTVPVSRNGIEIGTFMRNGAADTNIGVRIGRSTINLGFIITGLPGSGKTTEAMAIINALLEEKNGCRSPKTVIITPTAEWNPFAISHGMHLARLYNDTVPINFFRRPQSIDKERFYENLAMVLSSASNAGPYQNPMEKCMLNAFRKIYANENEPDPTAVYDEIENSIIELHGKRTGSGIKYTKHGENIRSALENLRGILGRTEFSVSVGVKIEELMEKGVVFDISNASGTTRAYLYALLLNQVYAVTSGFDANGDNELRLLICLEEAQTMFGDKESAAVQDIKQRIQDFRRQGVGLMLLTHNVNDIDAGIRRLCQLKLYLKQASDMATVASKDLVFTYAEEEDVTLKLKLLDSRVGAFNHVLKEGSEKMTQDTIFIRTKEYANVSAPAYENPLDELIRNNALTLPSELSATINLEANGKDGPTSRLAASVYAVRLKYLGEEIAEHVIEPGKEITQTLLGGKVYKLQVLDQRGRILKESNIKAKNRVTIDVSSDKIRIESHD
jgi:hypothetical protein